MDKEEMKRISIEELSILHKYKLNDTVTVKDIEYNRKNNTYRKYINNVGIISNINSYDGLVSIKFKNKDFPIIMYSYRVEFGLIEF